MISGKLTLLLSFSHVFVSSWNNIDFLIDFLFCEQICNHFGSKADPDQRDKQADMSDIEILKGYVARYFPGLVPEPAVVESCMYTVRFKHTANFLISQSVEI